MIPEIQDPQDRKVHRVSRAIPETLDRSDPRDLKACKGHPDLMEHPDSPAGTSTATESRTYLQRISMATWL